MVYMSLALDAGLHVCPSSSKLRKTFVRVFVMSQRENRGLYAVQCLYYVDFVKKRSIVFFMRSCVAQKLLLGFFQYCFAADIGSTNISKVARVYSLKRENFLAVKLRSLTFAKQIGSPTHTIRISSHLHRTALMFPIDWEYTIAIVSQDLAYILCSAVLLVSMWESTAEEMYISISPLT